MIHLLGWLQADVQLGKMLSLLLDDVSIKEDRIAFRPEDLADAVRVDVRPGQERTISTCPVDPAPAAVCRIVPQRVSQLKLYAFFDLHGVELNNELSVESHAASETFVSGLELAHMNVSAVRGVTPRLQALAENGHDVTHVPW